MQSLLVIIYVIVSHVVVSTAAQNVLKSTYFYLKKKIQFKATTNHSNYLNNKICIVIFVKVCRKRMSFFGRNLDSKAEVTASIVIFVLVSEKSLA
jgi:hypothetical protein